MPVFGQFADPDRVGGTGLSTAEPYKRKDPNEGCLRCPKCKNTWFEEVRVSQFRDDHTVSLGQGVPTMNAGPFVLLRCAKCSDLTEPRLLRQARDVANVLYDNFIDAMQTGVPVKSDKV